MPLSFTHLLGLKLSHAFDQCHSSWASTLLPCDTVNPAPTRKVGQLTATNHELCHYTDDATTRKVGQLTATNHELCHHMDDATTRKVGQQVSRTHRSDHGKVITSYIVYGASRFHPEFCRVRVSPIGSCFVRCSALHHGFCCVRLAPSGRGGCNALVLRHGFAAPLCHLSFAPLLCSKCDHALALMACSVGWMLPSLTD
jgi:hypothetical protein